MLGDSSGLSAELPSTTYLHVALNMHRKKQLATTWLVESFPICTLWHVCDVASEVSFFALGGLEQFHSYR
jgi:hypothetical protein